jgi:hypothetical protein
MTSCITGWSFIVERRPSRRGLDPVKAREYPSQSGLKHEVGVSPWQSG